MSPQTTGHIEENNSSSRKLWQTQSSSNQSSSHSSSDQSLSDQSSSDHVGMKKTEPANTERNPEEEYEKAFNILQLPNPDFPKTLVSRAPTCHFLSDLDTNKRVLADVSSTSSPMVLKLSDPNALYNRVDDFDIIGSSNGLLCLFRPNHKVGSLNFSLSNPITGESTALPVIEGACCRGPYSCLDGFGFGFSSVSHVYKLVRYTIRNSQYKKAKKAELMVLTVGSGIWRSIGKISSTIQTTNGVFHNGFLHWICKFKRSPYSRYIRAFDVESERFENLPMPPCKCYAKLGVLNGSLSITSSSLNTLQVWLMKECRGKKFWTRELQIHDRCLERHEIEVLKLIKTENATIEVLLFVNYRLSLYTFATRSLVEVQIDGIPYRAMDICVHIPSFVSPKDIIRDYNSKHPEEVAETSDIKLQAENNDTEVVEIRRGQPTTCLPLPKDLKHVSAATASTLLEMIGLNALLLNKCMATRDEIKRLRKENEELRATAKLVSGMPDDDASPSYTMCKYN